jgi:protein SCO1/2
MFRTNHSIRRVSKGYLYLQHRLSSNQTSTTKYAKTFAGSGTTGADQASSSMIPRGPVSWVSLGLVAVAAASAASYYQIERERRLENAMGKIVSSESGWSPNPEFFAKRKFKKTKYGWFPVEDSVGGAGKPAIGGEWSLIDLEGNLVTNKSFEGKWTLLYFGFARCPDICPSEMVKVGTVMDTLKKDYPQLASQVKPIFVSVDPARDSLKALKEYAKDFHPDYIFLTGSPEQVQQMAKKYRVYVSKADETEDGDYLVDHSIVIYFHDDQGELSDCFTQSMRPSDVVEKIVEKMMFVPKE